MAVAMAVRMPKQSERLAATLYSPPETWISRERALRKGMMPGSRRVTRAPRERKSSWASGLMFRADIVGSFGRVGTAHRDGKDGGQCPPYLALHSVCVNSPGFSVRS